MAASKDRKGVNPSVLIPEEEQSTFGQQSPYAAGFNDAPSSTFPIPSPSIRSPSIRSPSIPSAPPTTTASSQPSATTSPRQHPAAAPTVPFAIPAQQDAQHYPEDDQPPPAYDEVAQPPRAPQNYYGDNNNHGYTNPSAPLLPSSRPPATSYSTIPPATPYTPGSPRSTYDGSDDGSRRFNKFWLIFLAVVVLLSITVHDDDDDSGNGNCGTGFTRSIGRQTIPLKINDIIISANGVTTTVIMEQRDHAGEDPDMSEIVVFGTGRDRDEFKKILLQSGVDPSTGKLRMELFKNPETESNDCMSATIRFSLSPRMRVMEKLKIIVDEGSVTLAMLLPSHPLQIKDLSTRVVTGYTRIDADVMVMALGGSVGLIEGNVVVGTSMSVLMVDGYVSLNVSQSTDVMAGKVIVTNGNIDVGLTTPYVGSFQVEAGSGSVGIHHVDMETTKVKYESDKVLKGWRTETGQTPWGRYSSLKLNTHVSTTAEPSATNATTTTTTTTTTATALHTEEEPMQPSPVAAVSTPGAEAKASGGKEKEARPKFIDLIFDTILLEESTLHRSRSAPVRGINNSNKPILVPLFYTRLAKAFEIAQEVCHAYHEVHPKHGVSALAENELEDAGLEDVEKVKMYVRDIGGCNGYFLDAEGCRGGEGTLLVAKAVRVDQDGDHDRRDGDKSDLRQEHAQGQEQEQEADSGVEVQDQDHSDQQQDHDEDNVVFVKAAGIVFPSGRLSDSDGYSIPALNEVQIKEFNDRYGHVDPEYQDMVARVLFRLRKDYWNRTITASDIDRSEPELLMPYGSRYAQRRREIQARKQAEKAMGSSDAVMSQAAAHHLGEISQRLKGLQIVEAGGKGDRKPTYGLQGLFDLPLVVPAEGAFKTVGDGIMALYRKLVPSQEYMTKRTKLVQKLQGILNIGFPGQELRLEVFGSYASGLGSESSDADLCITTDHFQQTASYNNVRAVANVLRRGGMMQVQPITNARVPIVKFVDPATRTKCDVNTNHVLGIHNSELIRCYTMIDDRVRPFLYSLKTLVKKHGINDSSQSWLSSYAYVMMAIGFLQAQEPPVLPALQMQPESHMTELYIQMNHEGRGGKDVINCTFDRDPGRYKDFGAANTKSVGQLLIEFFEFYSRFYDYQTMEVNVRVGGGIRAREELTKARKNGNPNVKPPQRGRGEKKLIVMDPFILDRNVAGSCSGRHLVRVWTIFETLYLTLSCGDFQGAFETISGHAEDDEEFARGRYPPGGRKGGLTPAQEKILASKQARAAAQVKIAAVRPRTPVQVQQAPVHPQVKVAVIPVQAQGQVQGKTMNGAGATETHRSREKKTERKLERKEIRREQRESHKASRDHQAGSSSSSSRNISSSIASTPATAEATQQTVQEPAVVQVVASATVIASGHADGKNNATAAFDSGDAEGGAVDGDDAGDDNDSQQGGPDGESRSRKRRQRRSVARTLHSATAAASTGVAGTAASDSVVPAPAPPAAAAPLGGTAREGAIAAAVFASAVARATNSVNLKQSVSQQSVSQQSVVVGAGSNDTTQLSSTNTNTNSNTNNNITNNNNNSNNNNNKSTQQPLGDQFAQHLQQKHLQLQQQQLAQQAQKKQQKQQKQLNKQLNRQMNKQQQGQQQGPHQGQQQQQQQQQQLNPQFPVLAKTHKLLLGKTKEG
ncbi:hypothetical protein BGX30_000378, partial [Mortierella sp. GBA39]